MIVLSAMTFRMKGGCGGHSHKLRYAYARREWVWFSTVSVLESVHRVLKACTREDKVLDDKISTRECMVFQRIYVKEGIILFSSIHASVSHMLSILDFRNYVNLNKRLQRIMFSSSCTIKGMLFELVKPIFSTPRKVFH